MEKSAALFGLACMLVIASALYASAERKAFAETSGAAASNQAGVDGAINGDGISGTIANDIRGTNLVNIAAGEGASAALGSVVMAESSLNGRICNQADVCDLMNIAGGLNSDANFATVKIENSVIGSTIVNRVSGRCAKNIALGAESCANFGSVVVKNHGVNGLVDHSLPAEIVNNVTVGGPGNDCNVAEAGQVSNKNSIVFK